MTEVLDRSVHFVGTYPVVAEGATDATTSQEVNAAAMAEMMRLAGPYLESLPAEASKPVWIASKKGERPGGKDSDLEVLQQHAALHLREPNEKPIPNDYLNNEWRYEVKKGEKFTAGPLKPAFEQIYVQPVRENWETFQELRKQYGRPDLRYQFGLPSPLNPAIFAFRREGTTASLVNGLLRYQRPFAELYQHVVDTLNTDPAVGTPGKDRNTDFRYQVELPAEPAGMNKMWPSIQPATNRVIGDILAHDNAKQIAGFPEGAEVDVHLCKGDFEHHEYSSLTTRTLVDFGLALIRHWPAGRVLNGMQIPLGSGKNPPPVDGAHYEALGELSDALNNMPRPEGTRAPRLIYGYIHEANDLPTQRKITRMIEHATGQEVRHVSAACGLGRIDREAARLIIARSLSAIGA